MYFISDFCIERLLNAEFTAFALNFQKAVTEVEADVLGIEPKLMTAFNERLKLLIDQVYTTQGSSFTAQMQVYDNHRVQIFRRIHLRLQMVENCDDSPALLACREKVQTHLLMRYPISVTRMALQQKTAILSGFLHDLSTKLSEDDLEALGIESDISALTQANNAFMQSYNQRTNERAETANGLTARLRSELYDLFRNLCFLIQATANSTLEENASKAAACQSFIAVINVLLADAKKRYLQRMGRLGEEADTPDIEQPVPDEGDNTNHPGNTSGNGSQNGSTGNQAANGGSDIPDDVVFPGM